MSFEPGDDYWVLSNVEVRGVHLAYLVFSKKGGLIAVNTNLLAGQVDVVNDELFVNGERLQNDLIQAALQRGMQVGLVVADYVQAQYVPVKNIVVFVHAQMPASLTARGVIVTTPAWVQDEIRAIVQPDEITSLVWQKCKDIGQHLSMFKLGAGDIES